MFRTALRSSAGVAFRQRSVARRYASSHSSQKPAGDLTWAAGSAAVFGSITAYLLLAGGGDSTHPAEAAVHSTTNMKIADASGKSIRAEDAPQLVNTAAESVHKGSGRKITSIDTEDADSKDDGEAEESSDSSSEEPAEGRKAEDIPESELTSKAAQASTKAAESVAAPLAAMANNTEGTVKAKASEAKSMAKDVAGTVQQKAGEAKDKALEYKDKAAQKFNELTGKAQEKASDLTEKAKETAEDVKEKAKRTAEDVKEKTKETAEEVTEKTKATAQDVKQKTKATAEDVKEKTKATAEDVKEKTQEKVGDVKEKANQTTSTATSGQMEASDEGRLLEDIPASELQNSLHQAEQACVPKATWADPKAE